MATFEVTSPDGRTFEINAPDGASDSDVLEYAKRNRDFAKYDPTVSTGKYLLNRAQQGAAGLLSLPAEIVYHGGQLLRRGLSAIPGYSDVVPDVPIESPAALARRTLSDTTMKPPSRSAEIMGGAAEFAGAGVLPSAAVVGRAAHKIPALLAETGSTVLGGIGSEVGGLPGAVAGSIVGGQSPILASKMTGLVGGAAHWLRNEFSAQAPREISQAIAAHPQAQQNMAMAGNVTQRISDLGGQQFRPTLAGITGAPGIIARESQIAGSSVDDLSQYLARQGENQKALQVAKETAFPAGGDISRTAQSVFGKSAKEIEKRIDDINASRERLASMGGKTQQQVGERLDALRIDAQRAARGVKNSMIDDVYETADRMGIRESMDDIVETARRVGGSDENIFQKMPNVYRQIIERYAPKQKELTGRYIPPDLMAEALQQGTPKPASFREIHSLWREANTQLGTAMRSGDSQSQYYIQQVRDALKKKLDKFEAGGYGEVTDKLREFNRFYATKYAPAFYEGVGGRMGATTRFGDMVKPEDVVSKFFTPSGIDDFNIIYGGNKTAQQELADGVIGLYRQAVVKDGKISPTAAQSFLRSHEEALNKLPDVKARLSSITSSNEAMIESATRLTDRAKEFNKSAVAKIANTDNVDALIDKALTDRRAMFNLIALGGAGGDSAKRAIARAIVDRIPAVAERSGADPLTFVSQNQVLLKSVMNRLGPDHYDNLKTIASGQTILGRTEIPTTVGAPRIQDAIESLTGSTPRTIWAQSANTSAGRQSPVSAVLHLASKFGIKIKEDQVNALMREAIYNPEIAAGFAKAAKGQRFSLRESNRIKEHLLSAGIRITSTDEE